jgi:transcriptional regulator with XRE-family HTH domain
VVLGESPAVARRRLRLALRRGREAEGLTQGQVAETLDWSLSKVNRIESGEVTVSSTDLRAMLGLYGITDEARVHQLLEDAKTSRRRGWWDEPKYREHLTPATLQLLQYETEASAIRVYQPTLIPGLLQSLAYAEIIINFWDGLSEEDRAPRLEVRMHRRQQVFGRHDPPQYLLILDESVLLRDVGGTEVMSEQLRELLDYTSRPNITVRVVPLADGALYATLGSFTICDLGDDENAVLYRESLAGDEISHASEIVNRRRGIFEQMWDKSSLNEEASVRLIEARAAAMLSSLDLRRSSG